ncbi:MAG: acetyl-CoA decarbonylase/synthase complex subunit gamma [Nitrospiraceae bacterium]|nr:MAG: acetyl-CoA decarbonylase/synthase complex subunit gamma [Nitrospiraceae bacterium]
MPKTNCRKCGFPTCLAFAMAISQRRVSPDNCPDISSEAEKLLSEAMRPPMNKIKFGLKHNEMEIGGEEVLYRHERTFYHQPALALLLSDTVSLEELKDAIETIRDMDFELLGEIFKIDMLAIKNDSRNPDIFSECAHLARDFPLLLISEDIDSVRKARSVLKDQIPIILGDSSEEWIEFAHNADSVLVIRGSSLDELAQKSKQVQSHHFNNIILYPEVKNIKEALVTFSSSREMAIKSNCQSLGFPLLGRAGKDLVIAAHFICKYAGIIILETTDYEELLTLMTLRFNIYSDPRKPLMMEPKLYEIGKPGENSPVLVTTNFALTYHMVHSEIVTSHVPCFLLITASDGLSVLSAWAADKFSSEIITKSIKNSRIEDKVSHRKIIIPGCVASLKMKLETESGWEALIGPGDAPMIPQFLKAHWV